MSQIRIPRKIWIALRSVAASTERSIQYHADEALSDGIRLQLFPPAVKKIGSMFRERRDVRIHVTDGILREAVMVSNEKGLEPSHFIFAALYLHCLCLYPCLKRSRRKSSSGSSDRG